VTNIEPGIPEDEHLAAGQPGQSDPKRIMVATSDPTIPNAANQRSGAPFEHRDAPVAGSRPSHAKQVGQPKDRSIVTTVLVTAAVASFCGVASAMGYLSYFGPGSRESASLTRGSAGSSQQSSVETRPVSGPNAANTKSSGPVATPSSSSSGSGSTNELAELKQQIMSLNQRLGRLGEQVDRVQELLSLTLPLLQRMAPKN
jgi:hypothetical protein